MWGFPFPKIYKEKLSRLIHLKYLITLDILSKFLLVKIIFEIYAQSLLKFNSFEIMRNIKLSLLRDICHQNSKVLFFNNSYPFLIIMNGKSRASISVFTHFWPLKSLSHVTWSKISQKSFKKLQKLGEDLKILVKALSMLKKAL